MHNIAVIGAGRIGRIHAGNAKAEPRISLKYIIDPISSSAEVLASATGASVAELDHVLADPAV